MQDTELDEAAAQTAANLNNLLNVLGVAERGSIGKYTRPATTPRTLCQSSFVDFMDDRDGRPIQKTTKDRDEFDRQRAICESCLLETECLQIAVETGSEYGIWGGKLPRERL